MGDIIYGNLDGKLIQRNGILTELFIENGIEVISNEDYKNRRIINGRENIL